ncbi:UNVERIFIED_CONTAM: hypothetical protein K2H54_040224 [Gekko kuhli]
MHIANYYFYHFDLYLCFLPPKQSPVKVPVKPEAKEETPVCSPQLDTIESENLLGILESPPKEAASVKMEQLEVDIPQSSQLGSISPLIEEEYVEVEEDTPKARAQEVLTEVPEEKPVVELPLKTPSLQESEEVSSSDIPHLYESASLVPKDLEKTSAELEVRETTF